MYLGNQLQLIPTTGDPFQTRFTARIGQKSIYVDLCFLYEAILAPFKSWFWPARSIENWKLILSVLFTYFLSLFKCSVMKKQGLRYTCYCFSFLFFLQSCFDTVSCFDTLEWKISACWSILAKNQIISLRKMNFHDRYTFYVRILFWQARMKDLGLLINPCQKSHYLLRKM